MRTTGLYVNSVDTATQTPLELNCTLLRQHRIGSRKFNTGKSPITSVEAGPVIDRWRPALRRIATEVGAERDSRHCPAVPPPCPTLVTPTHVRDVRRRQILTTDRPRGLAWRHRRRDVTHRWRHRPADVIDHVYLPSRALKLKTFSAQNSPRSKQKPAGFA